MLRDYFFLPPGKLSWDVVQKLHIDLVRLPGTNMRAPGAREQRLSFSARRVMPGTVANTQIRELYFVCNGRRV